MTTVRLSPELDQRLTDLVKEAGHSKAFYMREAFIRCVEDLEDVYIATKRLNTLKKTYSMAEVEAMYGLED
jgi:RHH-type rel operon transcriptional repressor/antitoxin RelB